MNHLGNANKMVETPRTDAAEKHAYQFKDDCTPVCESKFVRQLERELNAANQRIKRLRDGIAKQNQTIEQACGKVLGYPWFKDDQKNFPGSTEKDGVCVGDHVAETIVCELVGKYTEALDRIKRLEEAGEKMVDEPLRKHRRWILNEAKEANP